MYIQLPIWVFRILGQDKKVSSEYFIQILTELAAKLLKQRLNCLQLLTAGVIRLRLGGHALRQGIASQVNFPTVHPGSAEIARDRLVLPVKPQHHDHAAGLIFP